MGSRSSNAGSARGCRCVGSRRESVRAGQSCNGRRTAPVAPSPTAGPAPDRVLQRKRPHGRHLSYRARVPATGTSEQPSRAWDSGLISRLDTQSPAGRVGDPVGDVPAAVAGGRRDPRRGAPVRLRPVRGSRHRDQRPLVSPVGRLRLALGGRPLPGSDCFLLLQQQARAAGPPHRSATQGAGFVRTASVTVLRCLSFSFESEGHGGLSAEPWTGGAPSSPPGGTGCARVIVKTCWSGGVDRAVWGPGAFEEFAPFLTTAPARTRATRWAPVTARQRS